MRIPERIFSAFSFIAGALLFLPFLTRERGRARIRERYGEWGDIGEEVVWFHGASVGEVNGLVPLMQDMKRRYPEKRLLLTATSVTGLEQGEPFADVIRLLPFDSELFIRRALRSTKVSLFVFGETELWPILLTVLSSKGVPCVLVNGRMRNSSLEYYKWFRTIFARSLQSLSRLCVVSARDGDKFIELGADTSKVVVAGNSKYDRDPTVKDQAEAKRIRQSLFVGERRVLGLASLRPGEEEVWFPVLYDLVKGERGVQVVIAPRHSEKFSFFARRLEECRIPFASRSQGIPHASVILLDTLGELEKIYSICEVVFVGGTLEPYGGHNPLEPAMYGCCILMGPHTETVQDIVTTLGEHKAYISVNGKKAIFDWAEEFISGNLNVKEYGARAREVAKLSSGAVERIGVILHEELTRARTA